MARKSGGATVWVVFGVIALLAVGGGAVWKFQSDAAAKKAAAVAAADVPAVPKGRLQLLNQEIKAARYLAVDQTRSTPAGLEVQVLVLSRVANAIEGDAAMMVEHKVLDCARRRAFDRNTGYFDHDGRLVRTQVLAASSFGRPFDPSEPETEAACAKAPTKWVRTYDDFRAAQREVQPLPDGYEVFADTHKDDAAAFAWLCAAGAHSRWRAQTPDDCDRAVRLNPKSSSVRMERAFLNLKIGKRPQAESDFTAAIALDPKNPGALFGRGLLLALKGDKAASARDRNAAMDLDPETPVWIETNYGFFIDPRYRGRG